MCDKDDEKLAESRRGKNTTPTAKKQNLTMILIVPPPVSNLGCGVFKVRPLILATLAALALVTPAAAQIRVDARIQMNSGSCSGCDLSDKAMNGVRLNNANFSNSTFNNSNLSGGSLDGSDLSGAHFRSALMYRVEGNGVTMPRAVFEDATLTEAKLPNSKMADANLSRADLSRATFTNSDFARARFDSANLTDGQFQGGQFQGAFFPGAILSDSQFDGANFSGADLSSSQGLKQTQLDVACGNEKTRLPVGLSLPYCDGVRVEMAEHGHDGLSVEMTQAAERLDRAISDVENLLAASGPGNRVLRTRLQRIHSDLVQTKAVLGQ
jgi:uncharacterized protein YjbI with pentapeptide repeats